MTHIKTKYSSFYRKLVMSHLLVLLITVSIMAIFNYTFSREQHSQRMLDVVKYSGQQTAIGITARFSQMENVSELVRFTLQQVLNDKTSVTPQPQLEANTIGMLRTLRDSFQFLDISAWMPSTFFSADEGITFFNLSQSDGRTQLQQVKEAVLGKLSWIAFPNYVYPFMRFSRYQEYQLLSCFMWVSTLTEQGSFCFFIDVDEREIAALLERTEGTPIEQFIVDRDGQIISHPDHDRLYSHLPEDVMQVTEEHPAETPLFINQNVYLRYPLAGTGWQLIVSLPDSYLYNISLTSTNGLIIAVIIAIFVAVLVSLMISLQLTRKLKKIKIAIRSIDPAFNITSEAVELIETRLPEPHPGTAPDILDELSILFNKLILRLNNTMQTALGASLSQEKLRYQLLRAKINPHFLYNILDSIKICNSLNRIDDANLMLTKLAAFYRLILRKNNLDMITIGEELEIIRLYLEMEEISHEHNFSFSINTDMDIQLFAVPRFVLQPLVENCVIHGMPGDDHHMTINISIRYDGDAILIQICDDGTGIDDNTMARLLDVIRGRDSLPQKSATTTFFGLYNVSGRLKPYVMNPQQPIHYVSTVGQGTTVTIQLQQLLLNINPDEKTEGDAYV